MSSLTAHSIATSWLDSMVAVSWEFTLLVAVALVVDLTVLRKAPPGLRHALWALVLLRLLVPVSFESPLARTPAAPTWTEIETVWLSTPSAQASSTEARPLPASLAVPRIADSGRSEGAARARETGRPSVPLVLFALWMGVVLTVTSHQARRRRRAHSTLRPPDERLQALVATASERVGLRRPPAVRIAEDLDDGPRIEGALRPIVVLPESAATWSDSRLLAVLVHEVVHLDRRDPIARSLGNLVQIVYWFHPAVWIAGSRLRALREQAVDDQVIEVLGSERSSYLHALLDFAGADATPRLEPALGMASRRSPLAARLRRMMRRDYRPTTPTWRSLMIVSACALSLTLLVGSSPALTGETSDEPSPRIGLMITYPAVYLTRNFDELDSAERVRADGDVEVGRSLDPRPSLDALRSEHPDLLEPLRERTLKVAVLIDTEGTVRRATFQSEDVDAQVRESFEAFAREIRFEPTRHKVLGPVPADATLHFTIAPREPKVTLLDPDEPLIGAEVMDVTGVLPEGVPPRRNGVGGKPPYLRVLSKGELPELGGASLPRDVSFNVFANTEGVVTNVVLDPPHPRAGFTVPPELERSLEDWLTTFRFERWSDPGLGPMTASGLVDLRVRDGAVEVASRAPATREELAERIAEHYALPEGRVLDLRVPPHDPIRQRFYRFGSPGQARSIPDGPDVMIVHSTPRGPVYQGACFGCSTLEALLRTLGYPPHLLRSEPDLPEIEVRADVVLRPDADRSTLIEDLERTLAEKLDVHVDLELVTEPVRTLVVRGSYLGIERSSERGDAPTLHVFHRDKNPDPRIGAGGTTTDPAQLATMIGRHLELPAVDETIGVPQEPISVLLHRSAQGTEFIDEVLASIEEQSQLELSIEERPTEVLRISRPTPRAEERR